MTESLGLLLENLEGAHRTPERVDPVLGAADKRAAPPGGCLGAGSLKILS